MYKKVQIYIVTLFLLMASGIGYRVMAKYLQVYEVTPVMLPRPLAAFPMQFGDWVGKDMPVSLSALQVAKNDDYINRLYINSKVNKWVNLYVAYTAKPRNMLGHKPQKCYVGGGWVHDGTETSKVALDSGNEIPCLIHRFHRSSPSDESVVVLNFYVVNGQVSNDEGMFTGLGLRTPNISGDAARYVAQIQISSLLESSVRKAAWEITALILDFLPDRNGKIGGTEFIGAANGGFKAGE